ncbi:MAG: DUF2330 domain-containing protein, partial [bacterium]|nr:DUF2330 domain-containing protein [bacterium]
MKLTASTSLAIAGMLLLTSFASADPCGMVPPITAGPTVPIVRSGEQKTYVFHKDGVETFVIRPGYSGKVEDFGMLIPFPKPPALRKIADNVFEHIAASVDPPEVIVDLNPQVFAQAASANFAMNGAMGGGGGLGLRRDQVRVLREEAVGMYEVAVLEAGSAAALNKWMDNHGYKYPNGMDKVCEEYVEDKWCFVAVKTKVASKGNVNPAPGQREVDSGLPAGASFDGYVQGMGFRFPTEELVVPMRLSAFNDGDLRNIVYLLTDSPKKIRAIPEEYVVRQISGADLFTNVTGPLHFRIIGGTEKDNPENRRKSRVQERNPE